jgi:hypothetical protein
LLLATATTATRAEGGKAPRPAGAWGVLKAVEAFGDEAFAPLPDRMAIAAQRGRDVLVGRVLGLGSVQDDTAAEG